MQDLGRPAEIEEGIASVLEDVWSYCQRTGVAGRTVTVKIKYADFQIVTRSRTLSEPVSSREVLERTSIELVRTVFPLESGCGCWASRCTTCMVGTNLPTRRR